MSKTQLVQRIQTQVQTIQKKLTLQSTINSSQIQKLMIQELKKTFLSNNQLKQQVCCNCNKNKSGVYKEFQNQMNTVKGQAMLDDKYRDLIREKNEIQKQKQNLSLQVKKLQSLVGVLEDYITILKTQKLQTQNNDLVSKKQQCQKKELNQLPSMLSESYEIVSKMKSNYNIQKQFNNGEVKDSQKNKIWFQNNQKKTNQHKINPKIIQLMIKNIKEEIVDPLKKQIIDLKRCSKKLQLENYIKIASIQMKSIQSQKQNQKLKYQYKCIKNQLMKQTQTNKKLNILISNNINQLTQYKNFIEKQLRKQLKNNPKKTKSQIQLQSQTNSEQNVHKETYFKKPSTQNNPQNKLRREQLQKKVMEAQQKTKQVQTKLKQIQKNLQDKKQQVKLLTNDLQNKSGGIIQKLKKKIQEMQKEIQLIQHKYKTEKKEWSQKYIKANTDLKLLQLQLEQIKYKNFCPEGKNNSMQEDQHSNLQTQIRRLLKQNQQQNKKHKIEIQKLQQTVSKYIQNRNQIANKYEDLKSSQILLNNSYNFNSHMLMKSININPPHNDKRMNYLSPLGQISQNQISRENENQQQQSTTKLQKLQSGKLQYQISRIQHDNFSQNSQNEQQTSNQLETKKKSNNLEPILPKDQKSNNNSNLIKSITIGSKDSKNESYQAQDEDNGQGQYAQQIQPHNLKLKEENTPNYRESLTTNSLANHSPKTKVKSIQTPILRYNSSDQYNISPKKQSIKVHNQFVSQKNLKDKLPKNQKLEVEDMSLQDSSSQFSAIKQKEMMKVPGLQSSIGELANTMMIVADNNNLQESKQQKQSKESLKQSILIDMNQQNKQQASDSKSQK